MRYVKHLPLAAALLCASLAPSFADQTVYFVNGKAITVKSVEKGEKFTILEMEGGGRFGVPTDQIVRIEDYVVAEPAPVPAAAPAAPAAPPQAAPAPPSAAVQAVTPPTPLPLPTTQTGPGIGGRPLPGQNVAGLKPIEIGDPAPSEAPQHQAPRMGGVNRGAASGPMMGTPQVRQYNNGGRRPAGRPGLGGRRGAGRLADMNAPNDPPETGAAPATGGAPPRAGAKPSAVPPPPPAPPPTESAPAGGSETEEPPPPPPDDSNEEPSDPAPQQDDSSGSTSGGPS